MMEGGSSGDETGCRVLDRLEGLMRETRVNSEVTRL